MKRFVAFLVLCVAVFVSCPDVNAGDDKPKGLEKRAVPVARVASSTVTVKVDGFPVMSA